MENDDEINLKKVLAKAVLLVSRYLALVSGKNSRAFCKALYFSFPSFARCFYIFENLLSLHLLPSFCEKEL